MGEYLRRGIETVTVTSIAETGGDRFETSRDARVVAVPVLSQACCLPACLHSLSARCSSLILVARNRDIF